jgi:putative lipoprotein
MLVLLILAACGGTGATTGEVDATPDASVTGTVTYLQRSALAPGSVVTVQIQDVSRQDVAAEIIGEQVITTTGEQVPIAFSVPYKSADIVEGNRYAVRATITDPAGTLIFTSDTVVPVITSGAPTENVAIVVVPVGGGGATAPDAGVRGTVTYRQRSLLIPGSIVTVQIQDVSRQGAVAQIIGEQVIVTTDQQVPIAYEVPYSSADIVESNTYSMRATIENPDGRLQFISDTMIPVITRGAPTSDVEIMVVGVSGSSAAPDASVTGTISYLQRIALAEGSVITVQIQDVSLMDVAAQVIGQQVITTTGAQVPIAFEVPYSSADIVDSNTYALQARIESPEGQLIFINDTFTPVITRDAPTEDVEVIVVPVG